MSTESPKYNFTYIKRPDFKTIKVDGIYGGVTIRADINMNFYIETINLPDTLQYTMVNGNIDKEIHVEKKTESTRELAIGINMDLNTAKSLIVWLSDKVDSAEKAIAVSKNLGGGNK